MSKSDLRDKLDGDELDLSMMNITEVPVKEIAALPRAHKIDLSNNRLTSLPTNFAPSLQHITQLELGSNKLTELPNNIGCLINLRHLDLYNNLLEELPVSVSQLRSLKWLDVKGNPLSQPLKRAAGDCLNSKECEIAAKNVLLYLRQVQSVMEKQRQKKLKEEREREAAAKFSEEQEKAKKRAEKKAIKDKKKQEQIELNKKISNGNVNSSVEASSHHTKTPTPASHTSKTKSQGGWSVIGWLNFMIIILLFGAIGACAFIYTEGDLTLKGIQVAYPKLIKNGRALINITQEALEIENLKRTASVVGESIYDLGLTCRISIEKFTGDLSPYVDTIIGYSLTFYDYVRLQSNNLYMWICKNVDWNYLSSQIYLLWKHTREQFLTLTEELGKSEIIKSFMEQFTIYSTAIKIQCGHAMNVTIENFYVLSDYVQKEGPVILQTVTEQASSIYDNAKQTINNLIK